MTQRISSLRRTARRVLISVLTGGAVFAPLPISTIRPARAAQDEPVKPAVRDAVDRALAWLAKNQRPDGTFPQGDGAGTTAVPSLSVLAFLARGHVPGQGPYGQTLYKSIDYVLESQNQREPELSGLISQPVWKPCHV